MGKSQPRSSSLWGQAGQSTGKPYCNETLKTVNTDTVTARLRLCKNAGLSYWFGSGSSIKVKLYSSPVTRWETPIWFASFQRCFNLEASCHLCRYLQLKVLKSQGIVSLVLAFCVNKNWLLLCLSSALLSWGPTGSRTRFQWHKKPSFQLHFSWGTPELGKIYLAKIRVRGI